LPPPPPPCFFPRRAEAPYHAAISIFAATPHVCRRRRAAPLLQLPSATPILMFLREPRLFDVLICRRNAMRAAHTAVRHARCCATFLPPI